MKRFFSYMMLLCFLLTMLPLCVLATETETTEAEKFIREPGQCGEDLTWSYSGGTLTISGSGEMDHYPDGDAPWLEYKDRITSLVFTGSVTSVGECAFMDYDSLKEVDFGSAMHTIGRRAFKSCDGLTTFTLPASFRKFEEECFMGCTWLREIRCLGPMPSFRNSCLWDCPVSVFYPTTNPWPAEYVTPLYQSYQGKLQIFMGDGIEEAGKQTAEPAQIQPVVTEPEETVPETTVPETTVPETTEPETEPVTEAVEESQEEREVPTTEEAELEWLRETEPVREEEKESRGSGIWFALFLITGTLSLILIGALVFRRRSY